MYLNIVIEILLQSNTNVVSMRELIFFSPRNVSVSYKISTSFSMILRFAQVLDSLLFCYVFLSNLFLVRY